MEKDKHNHKPLNNITLPKKSKKLNNDHSENTRYQITKGKDIHNNSGNSQKIPEKTEEN